MFDYTIAHWTTFFLASLLLSISPGPDIAYILAHSIKSGKRYGFVAMFGIWTGAFLHVLFAAAGLSAVLATSSVAFSLVKWIGALYLIWLGIQALCSTGGLSNNKADASEVSLLSVYRQGVLVATLNPKVAIFFLAFLPQFVVEGAGPAPAQLFLHGVLIILVAAFVEPPMVLLSARLTRVLSRNTAISVWLDKYAGGLFIFLGMRLALTEKV